MVIAYHQVTTVIHPAETAFDFPALAIRGAGSERATALRVLTRTPLESGNGRFDAPPAQGATKGSAIIGFVGDQLFGASFRASAFLRYADSPQGHLGQCALMRLGTSDMQTDGQAVTIGHHHHLAALADLGRAYSIAPFLAGTKLPSRKACAHSSFVCASSLLRKARQMRSHVPSWDHSFNRRQHVVSDPYSGGKSSQAQPVLSTYRMPLRVCRSSFRGRPVSVCVSAGAVQSPPIVRPLSRVCSCSHFSVNRHF